MLRIVDIETEGLHLASKRGFLSVEKEHEQIGSVPLDDIDGLIVHAHGTTWSNSTFVRLGERGVPVVICGSNHAPMSIVWPLKGHHAQGLRLRRQLEAGRPLKKRLWQAVVAAKIRMQGHVLNANGRRGDGLEMLARQVKSGDPDNREAQAARRYWKALFGDDFQRDTAIGGTNAMLNYGYTVLRAILSRAICGAGLHPTPGLFHAHRANAFALSDDLMEPYRPLVDQAVFNLVSAGFSEVTPDVKRALVKLSAFDLETDSGLSPLSVHSQRFVHSLCVAYETGDPVLDLPRPPPLLTLKSLGQPA